MLCKIVLYQINKGKGGDLYFACLSVFGFPSRMCIYWFSSSPMREKIAASIYYFFNHKMEALAFRHEAWEGRWSALYLTKHSVNKEVISIAMTVFLPFRMLIRGEKKNMIPLPGNIIYYYLELTGKHGCWWFFAKHRMLLMTKLKCRIVKHRSCKWPWKKPCNIISAVQLTLEVFLENMSIWHSIGHS